MEKFFGVLLIVFLVVFVLGPFLVRIAAPLLQRWMMHRMEDRFRRMAGMPSRKEEKRQRGKAKARRGAAPDAGESFYRHGPGPRRREPIIPPEYAEDVEFVEIKSYSEETVVTDDGKVTTRVEYTEETQIEDVQFEEIKEKK